MKYDFDTVVSRRGTACVKWDCCEDGVLPLWVADMDFKVAPAIQEAIEKRAAHGIFGYVSVQDEYYDAITGWFSRRHGWSFSADQIICTIGVVPAISAALRATTRPGDKVLIQSPVYNCFFSSIRNLECELVDSPLVYKDSHYEIDFEDFEAKAASGVKAFILCNPANPAGRIWTPEELRRLGEICFKHSVTVISDEIHCEFAFKGHPYTPFASLGEEFAAKSIVCVSASKAFNIAGLQCANIVVADPALRAKVDKAINIHEVCDINPFGMDATIAAYNSGADWLDALMEYIEANYNYFCEFFSRELPQFPVTRMEGTYLAWVKTGDGEKLCADFLAAEKVRFNGGRMYGDNSFLRINLACPRSILEEALKRFKHFIG